MTTEQILNLYEIRFNKIKDSKGKISSDFSGGDEMELYFFVASYEFLEDYVIPLLNHYIDGNLFARDNNIPVERSTFVNVELNGVIFKSTSTNTILQTIPLEHFKAIILAWLEFIN